MFNLLKIQPIIDHLHHISPGMFRQTSTEIVIHCIFCDDALRKNASSHGHFYLSTTSPIFNCFRCNSSGTLVSFLLETGFEDKDVISYVSSFIKINFTKDYFKIKDKKNLPAINDLKKNILLQNIYFKKNNKQLFNTYIDYLKNRIGDVDFLQFLLFPKLYENYVCVRFINYDGENISLRYIDNPKKRYLNNKNTSGLYYFQSFDLYNKYNKICICEGPFDIINLYLYNDLFKDNLFICLRGKNYIGIIERLLLEYMLLNEYSISIVFDNDVKNSRKILRNINTLIGVYSGKIQLTGYKPALQNINDVAEFPAVEEINYVNQYI